MRGVVSRTGGICESRANRPRGRHRRTVAACRLALRAHGPPGSGARAAGRGQEIGARSWIVSALVFWGLVIAGLVIGIRWLITERKPPAGDRALAVLRERYARGEISKEEFETSRRDLEAA